MARKVEHLTFLFTFGSINLIHSILGAATETCRPHNPRFHEIESQPRSEHDIITDPTNRSNPTKVLTSAPSQPLYRAEPDFAHLFKQYLPTQHARPNHRHLRSPSRLSSGPRRPREGCSVPGDLSGDLASCAEYAAVFSDFCQISGGKDA